MPGTRTFFVACLIASLLLLIVVPALSGVFAPRTMPADAAQGFRIWQAHDCAGCHSFDGQGAPYAPDLTRIYSLRGAAYLRQFLRDPAAMSSNALRTMPSADLTDEETEGVLAFLKWADENTGLFLPKTGREQWINPGAKP